MTPPQPEPLLDAAGVVVRLGDSFAVELRQLRVARGEALAIVGQSGSGKSTLLHVAAGILAPASAERLDFRPLDGPTIDLWDLWRRRDLAALRRYRARCMGYVLQSGGLAPFLSVRANIALPVAIRGGGEARIDRLLEGLGLAHLAGRKPHQISIGERQRVAIARALVHRPALVLADEPTASLDPDTADVVMAILMAAVRDEGATLVMVTHDADLARAHGFRLVRCARGATAHHSVLDDRVAA